MGQMFAVFYFLIALKCNATANKISVTEPEYVYKFKRTK